MYTQFKWLISSVIHLSSVSYLNTPIFPNFRFQSLRSKGKLFKISFSCKILTANTALMREKVLQANSSFYIQKKQELDSYHQIFGICWRSTHLAKNTDPAAPPVQWPAGPAANLTDKHGLLQPQLQSPEQGPNSDENYTKFTVENTTIICIFLGGAGGRYENRRF